MKIDRRSFLSFVIGGAAGTALSPIGAKLTDDSSIWTQMWPWTPVPEDGEVSLENSICTLCPGGCGITVRKVEDRAIKIEGRSDHPVNQGGICILGLSGLQLLYGPTRVASPMKRVGKERGKGNWEKISWEQAISEVAEKLTALRDGGRAHTLGWIDGNGPGSTAGLMQRFLAAYGSPNFINTPSIQDSYDTVFQLMHGVQGHAGFDLENADFLLSFGSGILDGWGSPVRMFRANSHWQETGAKVIQVESRLSNTAAKADAWLAIEPGTEAALALGMAHVIVAESLFDAGFVRNHTSGFSKWRRQVLADYSPAQTEKITGVEKASIIQLARAFAGAKKPLAICGRGEGRTPGGSLGEFMAVHALNALVGNINRKGGIWAMPEPDYIDWPAPEIDGPAGQGLRQARIDGAGTARYPLGRSLLNRLPAALAGGKPYGLEALFVSGSNPLYTMADTTAVQKALDTVPYVVSFSSFMDETAAYADLILPDHVYLEGYRDVPVAAGFQRPVLGLATPVVAPRLDTRQTGDVVIALARALGGTVGSAFPWENFEACLEETLGVQWKALKKNGFAKYNFRPAGWRDAFKTGSGKFAFAAAGGVMADYTPVAMEGEARRYPLTLVPYDSMRLSAGYIGNPPFMTKTVSDAVLKGDDLLVEVNPKTAGKLGLAEGDRAVLKTPRGRAEVRVHLFDGIHPDLVAIPRGLGHSAYDKYLAGKGVNVNTLMGSVEDPVSGLDAAWGIRAKLSNA